MADMKNLLVDIVRKYNKQEEVLSNVTASLVKDTTIENIVSNMDDIVSKKLEAERAFEKVESLIETYQITEYGLSAALINQVYLRGQVAELTSYYSTKVAKINFIQMSNHLTSYVDFIKKTLSEINLLYTVDHTGSPTNIKDINRMTEFVIADVTLMRDEVSDTTLKQGLTVTLDQLNATRPTFDGTKPMALVKYTLEQIYSSVPDIHLLYEGVNIFYSKNLEFRMKAILVQIEQYRKSIINTVKSQIEIEKNAFHRDSDQIIEMYNQIIRIQTYTSNNIDTVLGFYPLDNVDVKKFVDNLSNLDVDMQAILYILNERNTQKLMELEEYKNTTMRIIGYSITDSDKVPPFNNIASLIDNYSNWITHVMSMELFNSTKEADKYLCKFLIKDHDYLGKKYKEIFSRNLTNLETLYEKEYTEIIRDLKMSKSIISNLSKDDFVLTNTKTFFISLLFPDINVFFGKKIDEILDLTTGEILIEDDFLFAITKSFIIMTYEQKRQVLYEMVDFVVDHAREDTFKDFSECIFSSLIMKFLEMISLNSSNMNINILSNIGDLLNSNVFKVNRYIECYSTLYTNIIIQKRLPSFELLNYFDDNKQTEWFTLISVTPYAAVLP